MPRDQRRLQLLDVASEVFADNGYHNAAMDQIAEAAGVSKPVLYQHFPSKLDLYLALVDRSCDQLVDQVRETVDSTDDNAERVRAAISSLFCFVSETGRGFRFVFESDLTGDAEVQRRIWRAHLDLAEKIGKVITADTRLPHQESMLLGMSLVGMAQVSARYWISEARGEISAEEASELISTLAWAGIRSFPLADEARAADAGVPGSRPGHP